MDETETIELPAGSPPQALGRYLLLQLIGEGGMAQVWRGVSVGTAGFTKPVAVKRILPHLAGERAFVNMFIDEAKIASTISHPNVVQVLDLGEEEGAHYIVMEYVAGRSLASVQETFRARGKSLPVGFCLEVVHQTLMGLKAAHQKKDSAGRPMNIIHRDVSPSNILVGYNGVVKLGDFGIARANSRLSRTEVGTLRGKPAYMAPEMVKEAGVDHRADIYAVGVVLHELIAMKPMREGHTAQLLFDVTAGTYPRLADLGVNAPPSIQKLVDKALAPDLEKRFRDAHAFAAAVREVAAELKEEWTPERVSALMLETFPDEAAKEGEAERVQTQTLSNWRDGTPAATPRPAGVPSTSGEKRPVPVPFHRNLVVAQPARRGVPRWWWVAGVVAVLLVGGGAAYLVTEKPWAAGEKTVQTEEPGSRPPSTRKRPVRRARPRSSTPAEGAPRGENADRANHHRR
ncbi:MAG: serine/threonine-protein kinase [Myxococcota bacterium]